MNLFTFMNDCTIERKKQFDAQEKHESVFDELDCKDKILEYLISQHRKNRIRTKLVMDAPWYSMKEITLKALQETTEDQRKLTECFSLNEENKCVCFQK